MCKDSSLPTREAIDGPSDAEIDAVAFAMSWLNNVDPEIDRRAFARTILARFGAPQLVERKAQSVSDNWVIDAARAAMNASTENEEADIVVPSHLAAALSLLLDEFDATPAQAQAHGKSEAVAYPALPRVVCPGGTLDEMLRAYVDADRAQRPAPAAEAAAAASVPSGAVAAAELKRLIGSTVNYPGTPRSDAWVKDVFARIDALTALASQVSAPVAGDGWKLVPVKPTPEMLKECNNGPGATVLTNAEIWRAMLRAAPVSQAGVPASQPVPGEKYCLDCKKLGHLTNECWSTHGLNTPEAREVDRLCRAVNAAAPTCAK